MPAKVTRLQVSCQQCGRVFESRPVEARRYCSRACFHLASRNRTLATCVGCGTQFEAFPSAKRLYCSDACYRKHNPRTAEDLFWQHVDKSGGEDACWIWTAGTFRSGYGQFTQRNPRRGIGAHRFSYALAYGAPPDDLHVLHRCDNPPCVNPAHLFLGTDADNAEDKVGKDRHARGERSGNARITDAAVRDIRRRHANGEANVTALAREYSLGVSQIGDIVRGKAWKHVRDA